MEAEAASYELFFRDEGGYAERAYAGKAYRISKLYEETGKAEQAEMWYEKARKHARIYRSNPSMLIASLRYCESGGRKDDRQLCGDFGRTYSRNALDGK